MMYTDSYEVEKLRKLIENKKSYLKTIQSNNKAFAFQSIQKEIMFLQSEVMPILLRETSILHYEFMKYATQYLDKAIQQKFNGLILYQSLYDDYEDQPIIGIANERQNRPLVIDGLLIEVYSANGINPKNIEL